MSARTDAAKIGANIAGARTAAGMSQVGLADRVGVSRMSVSNWECGRCDLSAVHLLAVARALAAPVPVLLAGLLPEGDLFAAGWAACEARVAAAARWPAATAAPEEVPV